ncbi:MAG: hypothetical protein RLZ83_2013 [Pseudomonadota bacterium]|jgi:uncharacterized protein YndB with AHSA1/START domain
MFIKVTTSRGRRYAQLVESFRNEAGQPRQRLLATLGRLGHGGQVERLLAALQRAQAEAAQEVAACDPSLIVAPSEDTGSIAPAGALSLAPDPARDLQLQEDVPLRAEQLFSGWTDPQTLMQWFCPKPWRTVACEIDLRPGGRFVTVMESPEGQRMPANVGCYLAVEKPTRLVWTNLLGPDFSPNAIPSPGFGFVCELRFTPLAEGGTRFEATLRHTSPEARDQHAAMGFDQGWRIALAQLVSLTPSSDAGPDGERASA